VLLKQIDYCFSQKQLEHTVQANRRAELGDLRNKINFTSTRRTKMKMNTLGGILVGTMLALGWQTSMAAEAGKTAVADLSRDANASLH
jgi:hypothetical protein